MGACGLGKVTGLIAISVVYGVSGAQVEYQQQESNRCDYLIYMVHGPMVACSIGMYMSQ